MLSSLSQLPWTTSQTQHLLALSQYLLPGEPNQATLLNCSVSMNECLSMSVSWRETGLSGRCTQALPSTGCPLIAFAHLKRWGLFLSHHVLLSRVEYAVVCLLLKCLEVQQV